MHVSAFHSSIPTNTRMSTWNSWRVRHVNLDWKRCRSTCFDKLDIIWSTSKTQRASRKGIHDDFLKVKSFIRKGKTYNETRPQIQIEKSKKTETTNKISNLRWFFDELGVSDGPPPTRATAPPWLRCCAVGPETKFAAKTWRAAWQKHFGTLTSWQRHRNSKTWNGMVKNSEKIYKTKVFYCV